MKNRVIALVCVAISPLLNAAGTAEDAWNELLRENFRGRPAFSFVENDPALPNVLIYGDSISIGYTQVVRDKLAGTANVYRIHLNGGDSGSAIRKLEDLHKAMRSPELKDPWTFEWDVIHFNVGLHDLKYIHQGKLDKVNGKQVSSKARYAENLESLIRYLQDLAPEAKLVFATTTPVPEGEPGRHAGDAANYNQVASGVLQAFPDVVINDLHFLIKHHPNEGWTKPANVHYTQDGSTALGKQVAEVIREHLQ